MKYSQEFVWNAIFEICPHFKVMKDNNLHLNLSSILKDTALQCFLLKETDAFKLKLKSQQVIFVALTELAESGCIQFGTTDTF